MKAESLVAILLIAAIAVYAGALAQRWWASPMADSSRTGIQAIVAAPATIHEGARLWSRQK